MPQGRRVASNALCVATLTVKYFLRAINCVLYLIIFASDRIGRTNRTIHLTAGLTVLIWVLPIIFKQIGGKFDSVDTYEYP